MENNIINYGRNLSWISFNGKRTDQFTKYPLFIQSKPNMQIPEREYEKITIPGLSGELLFDKKRYKNIKKTYYIGCEIDSYSGESENEINYIDRASEIIDWLVGTPGYCKLIESYDESVYMLARLESQDVLMENVREGAIVIELIFDCKPFKYYVDGDNEFDFPWPEDYEEEYPCYRILNINDISNNRKLIKFKPILKIVFNDWAREHITDRPVYTLDDDHNYIEINICDENGLEKTNIKIDLGYCEFLNYQSFTTLIFDLETMLLYKEDDKTNLSSKIMINGDTNITLLNNYSIQITFYGPSYDHPPIIAKSDMYEYPEDPEDPSAGYNNYSRIAETIRWVKLIPRWCKL